MKKKYSLLIENIKQIIRWDWRKFALMIVLIIPSSFIFGFLSGALMHYDLCPPPTLTQIIFEEAVSYVFWFPLVYLQPLLHLLDYLPYGTYGIYGLSIIIGLLIHWYILSGIIVWIFDKLRKKK